MKFECESCHAQYMISDEKVGRRGVKVKCKRCSHVIVVRPGSDVGVKKARAAAADKTAASPVEENVVAPAAPAFAPPPLSEATGPARPAPVSMMANDTQTGGAIDDALPSRDADKTQMGRVEPLETQADVGHEQPASAAPAPAIKGESSIGDALDDQLAGAFNSMFDEGRPASELVGLAAAAAENPEEQRGPTKILDLGLINALVRATAETSQPGGGFAVDKDALASLRSDLGGSNHDEANAGFGGNAGDDGADDAVWHAAIDDEDIGPLTLADLGRYIESGGVDRDSLVWKAGMDNWLPAGEVRNVRDLFARAPMPKLAPLPPEDSKPAARSKSPGFGFDIGGPPVNQSRGSSPFDAVPGLEESDPSWQPHGLTAVYQAANLAEAAGASGGVGGNAGSASRGASATAEPEWRPSASSALASLVNDEIDRLSKGPLVPVDDGPPLPADDSSINSSLPFSNLAGVDLDAGPAVADMGRPTRTQNQMPAVGHFDQGFNGQQNFGQPQFQQNFAPPAPAPARSPLIAVIAVAGVAMFGLMAWKVFFAPPVVVVAGQQQLPAQVAMNTPPVAPATNTGPVAPPVIMPAVVPPIVVPPGEVAPVETPPESAPAQAVKDPPKEKNKKLAAASSKVKAPREEPKAVEEPKEEPKKKATNPDCDPVLDFDCKAKGSSEPKVAAKTTLERSDILAVVKGVLPRVKACGEKNGASGTIKMSWKIDRSGKTSDVSVADPKFGGTPVGTCVANVVKGMRFPPYTGAPPSPVSIPLPLK